MAEPYRPVRDGRFEYADDAIRYVEATSCRLGCRRALPILDPEYPSGSCDIPLRVMLEVDEVPEWQDAGDQIVCTAREPLEGA